ncbi:LysR family transcriptional regulator [Rhodomicrobium vannielii ATCC 17100]|uniref:LysR family transcriptional regulator n=1 Tax=Rhodomicrobium vannielii TaxID=1069 RepID=UPI001918CA08|nr:LysR family transcriptional regulator [Rhodomicrobium vannielii]MBJ7532826.1 LysR family transcriptional regulator [Rhodomicrobium vannielii ATCC 17100]
MDDKTIQRDSLSLSGIEHFVASVEEGSMSAAALRLGFSTAHISKSIGKLEKRMGIRLLHRTTRQFSLTTAGCVFYERACRIIQGLREAEARVMWEGPAQKCSLRLLTSDFLAGRVLWPILQTLQARHPGIAVEIQTVDFDCAPHLSGGTDIRIWTGPSGRPAAIRLAQWPNFLMASNQYLEENGIPSKLNHLADHALVGGKEDAWTIQGPEGLRTLRHKTVFRSNAPDLVQGAIRAGLGIGLSTPHGLQEELASGQISRVLPAYASPMSHGVWAEALERRHHPANDVVLDHIREALKETIVMVEPEARQWAA